MSTLAPHLVASGSIYPARFVKVSGNRQVAQAGAGEDVCGISQVGTNKAPIPDVTSQYAAESGQPLEIHGFGSLCLLTLGGSVTAGDFLKADADGKGVTASSGDKCGALALEGGSSGEQVLVQVVSRKA